MKTAKSFLCFIMLLVMPLPAAGENVMNEVEVIRKNFLELQKFIKAGNGDAAAALVSSRTFQFYDDCRISALKSGRTGLEQKPLMQVILIFQLRHLLSRKMMLNMTGKDIFTWGILNGLVDKASLTGIDIHGIRINGNTAKMTTAAHSSGQPQGKLYFVKENDAWKLDILQSILSGEAELDIMRMKQRKTKTEYAFSLLQNIYGRDVDRGIMTGPVY